MAGAGPPPDPSSRKSAKNAGRPGAFVLVPASGPDTPVPRLPDRPAPGKQWLDETRRAWALWWTSPQALLWQPSDRSPLERLARLHDMHLRDPADLDVHREMRHLEDRYLLGPLAKRRGRVAVVGDADMEAAPQDDRRGPRSPVGGDDPRLRLVSSAGQA